MRAMRLVGLFLMVAMLAAGLMVSAGPAGAEEGRQLLETSGAYSEGCSWESSTWRWYPPDKYFIGQSWAEGGTSWTVQDGQIYLMVATAHQEWHVGKDPVVFHSQSYIRLYPVDSFAPDLSGVTGWYEGRMEITGIAHDPSPYTPPWWTGHFVAQGYGTFAGQTVQGDFVPTEWGNDAITGQRPGLCPGGRLPFANGNMTLRFTGKP